MSSLPQPKSWVKCTVPYKFCIYVHAKRWKCLCRSGEWMILLRNFRSLRHMTMVMKMLLSQLAWPEQLPKLKGKMGGCPCWFWRYQEDIHFSLVQSLSSVWLFVTPWITAHQASLSIINSRSSLRLTSIESVMLSSHLILCCPLLLLLPIPPSIRVFSNESTLRIGGQSIGVSALASFFPKNTQDQSPLEWTGWISLQSKGLSRVFSNTTLQKHQFFGAQRSSQSNSHIHTWPLEKP